MNFVNVEPNRIEYTQKLQNYRTKINDRDAEFPSYEKYAKFTISFVVTLLAVI